MLRYIHRIVGCDLKFIERACHKLTLGIERVTRCPENLVWYYGRRIYNEDGFCAFQWQVRTYWDRQSFEQLVCIESGWEEEWWINNLLLRLQFVLLLGKLKRMRRRVMNNLLLRLYSLFVVRKFKVCSIQYYFMLSVYQHIIIFTCIEFSQMWLSF